MKIENLSWVRKFERRLRVITFIEGHRYSILNNNCEYFSPVNPIGKILGFPRI